MATPKPVSAAGLIATLTKPVAFEFPIVLFKVNVTFLLVASYVILVTTEIVGAPAPAIDPDVNVILAAASLVTVPAEYEIGHPT